MSQILPLSAEKRAGAGTGAARATRRSGSVPGIVYGGGEDPETVAVELAALKKAVGTGKFLSTLYELDIAGAKTRVIPRAVQFHPVTDVPLHVDFLRLKEGATIVVAVPVRFHNEGISPGLKRGGVLNIVRHEVDLVCPVDLIPDHLDIDLAEADVNDSIHISAVALPEGVRPTITDRDFTIATIVAPSLLKSEEAASEAAAETAAAETPSTEAKS
ncbi:MAG: 50S ribosomal protein L25/general stress protein Ctc [Alphaproteobacteria bacterium]|nr:50S ribosomal protein L25/general stress protein Ctc [Alphaproteobacteria bacterium]